MDFQVNSGPPSKQRGWKVMYGGEGIVEYWSRNVGTTTNTIKADDPVTVSKYMEAKGLIDKPYLKWANRYLKNNKKFWRLCRQEFLS